MTKESSKDARSFRGQLMLQIASGRFFRPGVPLHETEHRYTVYSNAWFTDDEPIALPVGRIIASSEMRPVTTAMLAVVDRLEQQTADGTDDFVVATGGTDLVDDVAYVMTFVLNHTVNRDHNQVHRLVTGEGRSRGRSAKSLFPGLFEPQQVVRPDEFDDLRGFMDDLLGLGRDDFARVMRAIRNSVDATRRALDDPTGAYTDLVAALESLADVELSTPVTWDRYDGTKRKIVDRSLVDVDQDAAERVRAAVLEADRAGLKRRFVASTLARTSPEYYRADAHGVAAAPRAVEIERLLSVAYDIRSRRSHVLEDLGEGVWIFTDGAETVYESRLERVLTLAGLWRLIRHVVRSHVASAESFEPDPRDYRNALPGIVDIQLAAQYWIWRPGSLVETASQRLDGLAEALIGWIAGHHTDGLPLGEVCKEIETTVPTLPAGQPRTALIAIHVIWHFWVDPAEHRPEAVSFIAQYGPVLDTVSPSAFTAAILSKTSTANLPGWSVEDWTSLARDRNAARRTKNAAPLPPAIDALIQLEAADQLEAAGRHDEAVLFAAHAVEEVPGNAALIEWENNLVAGPHDPNFDYQQLLFGDQKGNDDPDVDDLEAPDEA